MAALVSRVSDSSSSHKTVSSIYIRLAYIERDFITTQIAVTLNYEREYPLPKDAVHKFRIESSACPEIGTRWKACP